MASGDRGDDTDLSAEQIGQMLDDGEAVEIVTQLRGDIVDGVTRAVLREADRPPPVLVARCEGLSEPDGVPCTGRLHYRWGQIEAACDTCSGRCGIAVANWITVYR